MTDIKDSELILQCAHRHARERPDAPYMTQPMGGGKLDEFSWARALDEAKRMAAHLKSLDLPPKSQIAILSKNCAWFILTDLAIWMAGHVSVALYPTLNAETVEYILEHSESKLLFVGKLDTWDTMKPGVPDDMPMITFPLSPSGLDCPTWSDIIKSTEPVEGEPVRDADDMALIIYTSGSTGRPKGVMHNFGGVSAAGQGVSRVLEVNSDDRMLSYLPLAHAFERFVVETVSFINGMHVFFAESLDTFVEDLKRAHPTLFVSVPRLWLKFQLGVYQKMPEKKLKRLLKIPIIKGIVKKKVLSNLGLDAVRFAGSGSAPIPAELIQWYRDLGLELLEGYGMSENFSYSHVSIPGKTRVGYVGNAYPEVDCKIDISDEEKQEGEVLIKSPANMMGYFKQPELTEDAFTDASHKFGAGYLKTGDRGTIDSEGRLRITGRVKELFKTAKGKYIAPAPIENILNNNSNVELSCVAGSGYKMPHAVIQVAEDLAPKLSDASTRERLTSEFEALLAEVNAKVEKHEKLGFLVIAKDRWDIENGFLTPTMKIKRNRLEEVYGPKLDEWYETGGKVLWES